MNAFYVIVVLLLLPVFPFSLLTNRFLAIFKPKLFAIVMIILFTSGNILLSYTNINSKILVFMAVLTILFYSFRLLGANNLKSFILYLYPVISGVSILWHVVGGDLIEFLAVKIPVLISLLVLFVFLSEKFDVIHQKTISGIGSVMPRFSIFFILSLLGLSSSLFFLGYEILELEFSKLPLLYGILLIVSWIFLNWSSIKLIEWLIYGRYRRDVIYMDLSGFQTVLLIFMLLSSFISFVFFGMKGLV